MRLLLELFYLVRDLWRWLWDALSGRKQRRYEHTIVVAAPPHVLWDLLRSRDVTFQGMFPMRVVTWPSPISPDLEHSKVTIAGRTFDLVTRLADVRVGKALLLELMANGSSPELIAGRDDYVGFVIEQHPRGTVLTVTRMLIPAGLMSGLMVPFGLRSGAERYRRTAEQLANTGPPPASGALVDDRTPSPPPSGAPADTPSPPSASAGAARQPPAPEQSSFAPTWRGLGLSLLALASFTYLWGFSRALLIAAIIILHELGHAAAMLMVGMRVKGIYLVPFFGGAAIAAGPYRNEWQLGFVALMGPGFSLVPSALLFFAAETSEHDTVRQAAQLSAIINLINLVPIVPLDGGQVLRAVLMSLSRTAAQIAGIAGAILGLSLAWMIRDPVIAVFVALGLVITLQKRPETAKEPMRWPLALVLLLAFFITIGCYVALIYFGTSRAGSL